MDHTRVEFVVGAAFALTFSATGSVVASDNPFALKDMGHTGVRLVDSTSATSIEVAKPKSVQAQLRSGGVSVLEGKCGGGKCGSQRVRQMMDGDGNGTVSRTEYSQWINRQAGSQFDRIDLNRDGVISPGEMAHFDKRK